MHVGKPLGGSKRQTSGSITSEGDRLPGADDNEALSLLCRAERPRLVGLLALQVGDRAVAEELAQEVLVKLCVAWPRVDQPARWLTRVAVNTGNSWIRRRMAERRAYARHGMPSEAVEQVDSAATVTVRQAVAGLPKRQRTAVILRFYEQLSVAETAALMGCAEGTVKALTHKAVRRLQTEELIDAEAVWHG